MSLIDHNNVKLGKKLGHVEDPRTFRLAEFLPRTAIPDLNVPKQFRLAARRHQVPMFANDNAGDCTFASQGHRIVVQEAAVGQASETQLKDSDVLNGYSAVSGYDLRTGANDNGAYMLDVANYMRKVGIGKQKDGSPHKVAAFIQVPLKTEYLRAASMIFGGLWFGVWLPISAQRQDVWEVPAEGPTGDGEPGSWGGHAIFAQGYDPLGLPFYTWATEMRMSWQFVQTYADEAFVFISDDFLRRLTKTTPRGFDIARLNGYLAELHK